MSGERQEPLNLTLGEKKDDRKTLLFGLLLNLLKG
jgi:hypothetical protein